MNSSTNASLYNGTNSSTSTLRPRNNLSRLISYEDGSLQQDPAAFNTSTSASNTPPRVGSRDTSPSKAGARPRSKGKQQGARLEDGSSSVRAGFSQSDRRTSSSIWQPWSSIQGLKWNLLGGDQGQSALRRSSSTGKPSKSRMQQDKNYGLKRTQAEWGPKTETSVTPAPIEEQKALLWAKRREALLLQGTESTIGRDQVGKYKRKDSNSSSRDNPAENLDETDVLVYRHKVLPNDTMAGVVIKYSCQPEAFRKANRFWPNDNIQRKEYVVLPVDACSVRGRKTDSPYIEGLTTDDPSKTISHPLAQTHTISEVENTPPTVPTEPFPSIKPTPSNVDSASQFEHNCWVLLPTFSQPIEILRISKSTLGYFPPARRKSSSLAPTPFEDSTTSTPKSSFDTLRHPLSHAAQQAQLKEYLQSANSSIRQQSLPRYLGNSSRSRSSSTVSTSNVTPQSTFLSALSGPGGVGNLRGLRTERAKPGPGDDPLNRKVAQYAPDILPKDHPDYQPYNNLTPIQSRTASNSARGTPRVSVDSIRTSRSNSSAVPATLAGWMGKVANSPIRRKNEFHKLGGNDLNLEVLGPAAPGDLIELADTPDELSRQLHDAVDEDQTTPIATPAIKIGHEDDMNERFPVRGRIRRAYEAG